jgi:hypothetical protein
MPANYHLLKDLLQLRIRMVCASGDIIISELVAKALIKFLQYLPQTGGIHVNKAEKLYKISSNLSVSLTEFKNP